MPLNDRLDYTNYPQLGEVVLSGGDPYALAFNSWPPCFLLLTAGLALVALQPSGASASSWDEEVRAPRGEAVPARAAPGQCFPVRGGGLVASPQAAVSA
jgi:hypothetical protein